MAARIVSHMPRKSGKLCETHHTSCLTLAGVRARNGVGAGMPMPFLVPLFGCGTITESSHSGLLLCPPDFALPAHNDLHAVPHPTGQRICQT
jgi:hypothetical protein